MTLILLSLSAICWAITSLIAHGKMWYGKPTSFFGVDQWKRKYRYYINDATGDGVFLYPLDNLYYRVFNIKHKERFKGSATIFVAFTDAMHLFQFLATKLIFLAIALAMHDHWWEVTKTFFIIWFVW